MHGKIILYYVHCTIFFTTHLPPCLNKYPVYNFEQMQLLIQHIFEHVIYYFILITLRNLFNREINIKITCK